MKPVGEIRCTEPQDKKGIVMQRRTLILSAIAIVPALRSRAGTAQDSGSAVDNSGDCPPEYDAWGFLLLGCPVDEDELGPMDPDKVENSPKPPPLGETLGRDVRTRHRRHKSRRNRN